MTATTTPDLDAIDERLDGLVPAVRRLRLWSDCADLLRLARAQQQRIAELEAQLIKDPIGEGELTAHVDWSRLQGSVEKPR